MQRSKEFQFLIGNHLHNSLLAAIEENNNIDISIVKNNRIITAISKSKARPNNGPDGRRLYFFVQPFSLTYYVIASEKANFVRVNYCV